MKTIRNQIGYIPELKFLNPGDILLFRPISNNKFNKFTNLVGMMVLREGGHYDTFHTAVCVDVQGNEPIIAHLTARGYKRDKITNILENRNLEDIYLVIYRPKSKIFAKKIAEIAGDEKSHNDVQWTYSSAVRTLYTPATFFKTDPSSKEEDTKENKIQKSSFCSKFTVEVIKAASTNEEIPDTIFWDYYPHLRSTAIPKTLEAFLYKNSQLYDYLIYVGKKPYEELKKVIQAILIEIKGKNSADYTPVIESYEKLLQQNAQNHSKNKLEKCFYLIKNMQPVFAGTSRNIYSNYEGVFLNMIRRLAFFPRDFSKQITIDTIPIPFETKSLETKIEIQPLDKFEEKYNINEDNEDQEKIERSPLLSQIPISDSDDRAEFKKDTGIQLITDQDITIQKICKDREYYLQQEHKYEELIYQKIKILIKIGQKIEELDCRINSCLLFSKISKKILINKCDLLKNIYRELEKLAEGHITFEIIAKNIKKWEKFQDLNTFCYFFGTRSDYSMFSSKRETQTLNRVKEVTDFIRRNNM